jgi:hypothetical protein
MNDAIIKWIADNLQYFRGLICKKCKREWFEKYGFLDKWQEIHDITLFLDALNPTFPQRVWHIVHDHLSTIKCANPSCQNSPKFWSFNIGYLRTCSTSCAQYDPLTQEKIQITNLDKYGYKYGLQNPDIIKRRISSIREKYGVNNISQVDGISEKKQETCLKNYGTKWFLERSDIVRECLVRKYGVENVQQVDEISSKTSQTRTNNFYDELVGSDRFKGKVVPSFSKEEYDGVGKEYKFKCTSCFSEFSYVLRWDRIPRCPICFKGSSIFEQEITNYIKTLLPATDIMENVKSILSNNRELDIYIPSKNLAIECNGLFWHGEVGGNKNRNYHLNKTIECESKNIHLIHIFEDEWILSPDIIKNRLAHIMGLHKVAKSIYARNCEIKEVSNKDKNNFLNANHIQGTDRSKIRLGLFYNNDMVAVMTFGSRRIFTNSVYIENEYELIRYATSIPVVGGGSKLMTHFIKTYSPKKIISYADRRWTYYKNNLYERIGFKNYRRFHRFGFAKHTLSKRLAFFDPSLTEWENMKNNGWDRIWDCGSLKYEMAF